jgi:peroxiredoxin
MVVASASVVAVLVSTRATPSESSSLAAGFSLPHLLRKGETVALSDYDGQPIIVNFFASWCVPCRKEMPALEAVYRKHRENGLVVIGVGTRDGERPLMGFALSTGVTFPVVWDGSGEVAATYRVWGIPTTHFIDRAGNIRETVMGALNLESLEEQIGVIIN